MKRSPRKPTSGRRRYHSPLRRKRAVETRERIIAAGAELLRGFAVWNWTALTVRGVAKQAGVNERTVYRHFANERGLRDAVMRRLEQQAGIDLDGLELADVADVARRIFATVAAHPVERRTPLDPTLQDASNREREALLRALASHTDGWSDTERVVAAAMCNVLWRVAVHDHLVVDWGLADDDAVAGITWVLGLLEQAIRDGRAPGR